SFRQGALRGVLHATGFPNLSVIDRDGPDRVGAPASPAPDRSVRLPARVASPRFQPVVDHEPDVQPGDPRASLEPSLRVADVSATSALFRVLAPVSFPAGPPRNVGARLASGARPAAHRGAG